MNQVPYQSNGAADVRPQTVVESALHSTAKGLEELASAIESLAGGASAVLRPEGPPMPPQGAAIDKLAAIQPEHCEVVKEIHSQRGRIEQLVNRVNNIRNRLEV
jgi:hypothetical protein